MSSIDTEANPGTMVYIPLTTLDDSGQPRDADSISVTHTLLDGEAATLPVTIAQAQDSTPANITGQYVLTFDGVTANLPNNRKVFIYIDTTIDGEAASPIVRTITIKEGNSPRVSVK